MQRISRGWDKSAALSAPTGQHDILPLGKNGDPITASQACARWHVRYASYKWQKRRGKNPEQAFQTACIKTWTGSTAGHFTILACVQSRLPPFRALSNRYGWSVMIASMDSSRRKSKSRPSVFNKIHAPAFHVRRRRHAADMLRRGAARQEIQDPSGRKACRAVKTAHTIYYNIWREGTFA